MKSIYGTRCVYAAKLAMNQLKYRMAYQTLIEFFIEFSLFLVGKVSDFTEPQELKELLDYIAGILIINK